MIYNPKNLKTGKGVNKKVDGNFTMSFYKVIKAKNMTVDFHEWISKFLYLYKIRIIGDVEYEK